MSALFNAQNSSPLDRTVVRVQI